MSGYLPYGRGAPGSWLLSGLVSFVVHGGVIAVLTAGVSQWFVERPLPVAQPEFQITLEQLETDTLAGLVERLGEAAGLDAAEDMDALDPDGELAPEDEFDEAALPDPEELEAEDPLAAEDLPPLEEVEADAPEEVTEAEVEELEEAAREELDTTEPEELDTAEAEDLTPEEPETTAPETLDAEEIAPEELAPETAETPEAPEPEELDVVEAAPAEEPLDTAEALEPEALEPEALEAEPEAIEPAELAEAAPVEDEPIVAPPEDLAALAPQDNVVLAPTEADPLIVEDGSIQTVTDSQVIDPTISETLAPEELAPVTTGEAEPVEPVTGALEPEELAALVPVEPAIPGDDTQDPVEPVAQPLEPEEIAPEEAAPEALEPEEATPETPEVEAVEATEPAVESTDPDTIEATAVEPATEQPRVTRRPRAPPSERDLAIGDLIQRIRAKTEDNCVIGLPRRDGEDGIGLALLAAEDGAMARFAEEVLVRPEDEDIRQTRTLLDERQCAVLSFFAKNRDYPATRIGMRVDNAEVPSGNRVSGVMRGVGNRNLGLFLVDNNGVVQDLERFTTTSGAFVRFDIPVTRVGRLRDTKQLLVAIASSDPIDVLKERSGQRAETFFADLSNELSRNAALAVVAFDVR